MGDLPTSTPFDLAFLECLRAFASPETRWSAVPREPHIFDSLQSLIEAADFSDDGVLSAAAVEMLLRDISEQSLEDQGLVRRDERQVFRAMVPRNPTQVSRGSYELSRLEAALPSYRERYLSKWTAALNEAEYEQWDWAHWGQQGGDIVQPDRLAFLVGSYLLNLGVHPLWILNFSNYCLREPAGPKAAQDVLEHIGGFVASGHGLIECLLVIHTGVTHPRPRPRGWLTIDETRSWLNERDLPLPSKAFSGGVLVSADGWDVYAMAEDIGRTARRLSALNQMATGRPIDFDDHIRVPGVTRRKLRLSDTAKTWKYKDLPKLLDIRTTSDASDRTGQAIELLAKCPPDAGAQAAALWSVVESIVLSPADRRDRETGNVVAAARASEIMSAAWLRFEVNLVFIEHIKAHAEPDRLDIRSRGAEWFANELGADGFQVSCRQRRALACLAAERARAISRQPVLLRRHASNGFERSLRFLYRHRNVYTHANAASVWSSQRSLDICGPAVQAFMDSVVRSGSHGSRGGTVAYAAGVSSRLAQFYAGQLSPREVVR